jgi:hypothetical protein
MKVLDLRCANDHRFEGWFASEQDHRSQEERGLVCCPMCGDNSVSRLPSAPRLNVSRAQPPVESPVALSDPPAERTAQARWLQAMRRVLADTEDVGPRFATEARRIHHGEVEQRGIRGQASRADAEALRDEGIEVFALDLPEAVKETLQ